MSLTGMLESKLKVSNTQLRVWLSCWCFIVNCIECFYVNDEPESKFPYTETIKLYCIVLYCIVLYCIHCLAFTCHCIPLQWFHFQETECRTPDPAHSVRHSEHSSSQWQLLVAPVKLYNLLRVVQRIITAAEKRQKIINNKNKQKYKNKHMKHEMKCIFSVLLYIIYIMHTKWKCFFDSLAKIDCHLMI